MFVLSSFWAFGFFRSNSQLFEFILTTPHPSKSNKQGPWQPRGGVVAATSKKNGKAAKTAKNKRKSNKQQQKQKREKEQK